MDQTTSSAATGEGELAACDSALSAVQRFLAASLTPAEDRVLRAHLQHCGDCRDAYRGAALTTARIGRERRSERVARERAVRRLRMQRAGFEANHYLPSRFYRLRTLLYPAFFCFLMVQVSRLFQAPQVQVANLAGVTQVDAVSLPVAESDVRAMAFERGAWCLTGAESRARVFSERASLELGPHTSVELVNVEGPVYFLAAGALELSGSLTLATSGGDVLLENARAEIRLDGSELVLKTISGEVQWCGADPTPIPPGTTRQVSVKKPQPAL